MIVGVRTSVEAMSHIGPGGTSHQFREPAFPLRVAGERVLQNDRCQYRMALIDRASVPVEPDLLIIPEMVGQRLVELSGFEPFCRSIESVSFSPLIFRRSGRWLASLAW